MTSIKAKPNTIRAIVDERTFYVDFDDDMKPLRIKERRHSILKGWHNATYWNAKTKGAILGSAKAMANRIVTKALSSC